MNDFGNLRADEKGDEIGGSYGYHGQSTVGGTVQVALSSVDEVLAREDEERKRRGY